MQIIFLYHYFWCFWEALLSYVSPTSQSTCPVFCILLKKPGYLSCRVSHGLDFVDYTFMGLFIIFLISYLSWKLILRSRGVIIVRFKFCEEYFIVFCEYIGLEVYGIWLSLFCIMLAAIDNCYYFIWVIKWWYLIVSSKLNSWNLQWRDFPETTLFVYLVF